MAFRCVKHVTKRLLRSVQPASRREFSPDYLQEFNNKTAEIEQLYRMRLNHIIRVDQPIILISQIQRSGGTLLNQLFDGHPECHTHPHELYIGYPKKFFWPDLDVKSKPDALFNKLFERPTLRFFQGGYKKHPRVVHYDDPDIFPFLLLPNLQREIFRTCVISRKINCQRDILNCYMTSYFNAWIDYQGLYESKKYVVAFVPRVNMYEDSLERFFADYPDGKLVSMIRDPKSWYASAHRKRAHDYLSPQEAIPLWKASATAMLTSKQRYGDKVYLMSFEKLLRDTSGCIRALAAFLGLAFDDILLTPTFQRMQIRANTAFGTNSYGVLKEPLNRQEALRHEDTTYVNKQASELYEKVLGRVD
jgi:hypothetical protein